MSENIQEMYERARAAFEIVEHWDQEKVDEMVAAVGWMWQKQHVAEDLARTAVDEAGMGIYEHKVAKQRKKTQGAMWDLRGVKTCGIVHEDKARGIRILAKPIGVIANVTPCTNPTATPSFLGLNVLKTRNAMIVSPHPRTKQCTFKCIEYAREALRKIGAPEDLFLCIEEPTHDKTRQLMEACDYAIATGGDALIKVVYGTATPAQTVGSGNVCAIVDKSADLAQVAHKVCESKTFDHATSCSSENSVALHEDIHDAAIEELRKVGGYMCSDEEREKLRAALWPDGKRLSRDLVARKATDIAAAAGIDVPADTKFLMVAGQKVGPEDRFSGEKLTVTLTVWKWNDFDEMVKRLGRILEFSGIGHSCAIHTQDEAQILKLAEQTKVGRINVNMPNCMVNSGSWYNGQPFTTTIGCGTWAGNITSENINWRQMLNYTSLSIPVEEYIPTDEELFGDYLKKHGRD